MPYLDALGFDLVGYGCTTCIGNSGPAARRRSSQAVDEHEPGRRRGALRATATSRAASTRRCAPTTWPRRRWWWPTRWPARSTSTSPPSRSGDGAHGKPVFLADIWPTPGGGRATPIGASVTAGAVRGAATPTSSRATTAGSALAGRRRATSTPGTPPVDLRPASRRSSPASRPTRPPLDDIARRARARDARRLGHDRPHLARRRIPARTPAGRVPASSTAWSRATSTAYGARRGNHEVMMRGTFGNIRLRNAPGRRQGGRLDRRTCRAAS